MLWIPLRAGIIHSSSSFPEGAAISPSFRGYGSFKENFSRRLIREFIIAARERENVKGADRHCGGYPAERNKGYVQRFEYFSFVKPRLTRIHQFPRPCFFLPAPFFRTPRSWPLDHRRCLVDSEERTLVFRTLSREISLKFRIPSSMYNSMNFSRVCVYENPQSLGLYDVWNGEIDVSQLSNLQVFLPVNQNVLQV